MDWITDRLALGGIRDALDHGYLAHEGVEAVLQLYGPDPRPAGFPFARASLQLSVIDGRTIPTEALDQAIAFIREQRALERKTLVACGRGQSRSAAFLAAYLCTEGATLPEAYGMLYRGRREVLPPHPEMLRSLMSYLSLPGPMEPLLGTLVRVRSGR